MQNDQCNTEGGIILDKSSVHTIDDQIDFKNIRAREGKKRHLHDKMVYYIVLIKAKQRDFAIDFG